MDKEHQEKITAILQKQTDNCETFIKSTTETINKVLDLCIELEKRVEKLEGDDGRSNHQL